MSLTPTPELRGQLRRLLDERIPGGGAAEDTRFGEDDLNMLLEDATHLFAAVAEGWRLKASWAMSERGGLESLSAGDEKYTFVSLEAYRAHCLDMAQQFAARVPATGSRLFGIRFTEGTG